jgi:hypothetical protein
MRKRFSLITFILVIALSGIGLSFGYVYHKNKVHQDKELLQTKLNSLFEGKISISDGSKIAYEGEFLDNRKMHYTFNSGGFSVYELTKESDGFVKSISKSGDIYFKEPESVYEPAQYFNGYKISGGYNRSNYRPSVQKVYDGAYEFLLKGNEKDRRLSYSPDKLIEIKNFPSGYYTDFHFMKHQNHPSEFYYTQKGGGKVYTTSYELKYDQEKEYFAVSENKAAVNKSLIISLIVGVVSGLLIAILITIILKSFSPNKGDHLGILSIKWRNTLDNSILTISPKTLGKYPVTLVENNIPIKGNAKINNNDIEIVFPNAEYYYQIEKKETDILELKNLTTEEIIVFEKLGSNAVKKRTDAGQRETAQQNDNSDLKSA